MASYVFTDQRPHKTGLIPVPKSRNSFISVNNFYQQNHTQHETPTTIQKYQYCDTESLKKNQFINV